MIHVFALSLAPFIQTLFTLCSTLLFRHFIFCHVQSSGAATLIYCRHLSPDNFESNVLINIAN